MLRVRWGSWKPADGRSVRNAICFLIGQRRGFASVSHDEPIERLDITCGSAGSITVDLYNSKALATPSTPLIIYLPPSGTHLKTQHPSIPPFLFSQFGALASINYRWNIPSTDTGHYSTKPLSSHPSFATHPFPTPLHDIFHAYNYLTTSLLSRFLPAPEQAQNAYWSSQSHRQKQIPRPTLVYGSYLGGTLAMSLGLTESFSSKRRSTQITGLITKNAILDWTEIATTIEPESLKEDLQQDFSQIIRNQLPWTGDTLHSLKRSLFNNPASCFDHFVSPTLFLYSAGTIPPASWVTENEKEMSIEDVLRVDVTIPSSGSDSDSDSHASRSPSSKHISTMDIQTTRSAHLKFPPRDSGLKIPRSLFLTTSTSRPSIPPSLSPSLSTGSGMAKRMASKSKSKKNKNAQAEEGVTPHKQAEEMARLMRRSIVLHEFKERAMYDSDVDPHAVSEERVKVRQVGGIMDTGKGEALVREWIEESLGGSS